MDGKQCTITWYVEGLKRSHVDYQIVSKVKYMIESEYGKMPVTRGKIHTYIGIDIEFIGDVKVTLHQLTHIR